jgi:hypothetical protein
MHLSNIDVGLWIASIAGESLLIAVLFFRRIYRTFPVFFFWILFILLLEPTYYWLLFHASAATYIKVFFALNFPQYLLEIGVLAEIAFNVLHPVKQGISRTLLIAFSAAMLLIAAVGFLIAAHVSDATLANPRLYVVVNSTMAILRLTTFLLIAGCSQLLGLNWKNHVLQLTSGLAFYAVVSLIVELSQSYLRAGPSYTSTYIGLDHLRIGGYLCTLYFWCYVFAKKEAPRKEFSPQMTRILVSLSGSAKRQRAVLARTRDQ